MNIDAKLRPYYLARILYERTDENHDLTTNQLIRILKEEYNVEGYRITVRNDIQLHNAMADSIMDDISSFVENNTEAEILEEQREIR